MEVDFIVAITFLLLYIDSKNRQISRIITGLDLGELHSGIACHTHNGKVPGSNPIDVFSWDFYPTLLQGSWLPLSRTRNSVVVNIKLVNLSSHQWCKDGLGAAKCP